MSEGTRRRRRRRSRRHASERAGPGERFAAWLRELGGRGEGRGGEAGSGAAWPRLLAWWRGLGEPGAEPDTHRHHVESQGAARGHAAPDAGEAERAEGARRAGYDDPEPRGARHALERLGRLLTLEARLLGLVVAGSVLAIGAVHPLTAALAALVALCAAVVRPWPAQRAPAAARLGVGMLFGLAGYTALQALPLPAGLVALLSPQAALTWADALRPFGEPGPRWVSLSLAPGASCLEAAKWMAYGSAALVASRIARRWGVQGGALLVFGSAVLLALVTLGHELAGAQTLYGFFEPSFILYRFGASPLINPNNQAGYLNLGVFCGLALALGRRRLLPRWAVLPGVATLLALSVLAFSRGGLLGLVVGVVGLLALLSWQRLSGRATHGGWGGVAAVAVTAGGAVVLGALGGFGDTLSRMRHEGMEKLTIIQWNVPMIVDHPWFGVGRGGYYSVFPAYRGGGGNVAYQYAENFPAQWAAEWGLPVALVALSGFAWTLRPGRLDVLRDPAAGALWVGVMALLLQNLVDLGMELPSVALALSTVLGTLWGATERHHERGRHDRTHEDRAHGEPAQRDRAQHEPAHHAERPAVMAPRRALLVAGLAMVLLAAWCSPPGLVTERARSQAEQQALRAGDGAGYQRLMGELRAAMLRFPGDPFLPMVGGLAALESRAHDALPWVARALERDPQSGRTHLALAEVLRRRGARGQALLELRLAVERESFLLPEAVRLVTAWTRDVRTWRRIVPEGPSGAPVLLALGSKIQQDRVVERLTFYREAVERDAASWEAPATEAGELMVWIEAATAEHPAGPCSAAQARCSALLLQDLATMERLRPGELGPLALRVRLLVAEGKPLVAERLLARRCGDFPNPAPCWQQRAALAVRYGGVETWPLVFNTYLASACARAEECASAALQIGAMLAQRGHWPAASDYFLRAAREEPSADRWTMVADAAQRAGREQVAAQARAQAARLRALAPATPAGSR